MKKYIKIFSFSVATLFLTGCSGPSAEEIAQTEMLIGPSVVLLLFVITVLLFWISKNEKLKLNKKMGLQFLFLFIATTIISLVIKDLLYYVYGDSVTGDSLLGLQLVSILTIPFLLSFSSLIIALIPPKFSFYTPVFVTIIYYLSAYTTLIKGDINFDLILLPIKDWFISIPLFIGCLILIRYGRKTPK